MNQQLPPLKEPEGKKLKPLSKDSSVGSILVGVAIAIVGLAIAAGLILFLLSNQEEPDPGIPLPDNTGDAASGSLTPEGEDAPTTTPTQTNDSLPRLSDYPAYAWKAKLPSGSGWTSPVTSDLSNDSGRLERTEVEGPAGAKVVVDWTPDLTPDPLNEVGGRVPANLPGKPGAESVAIEGGTVCPVGATCTDYLIPSPLGGGFAVLVGWPGKDDKAARLARAIARSLTPIAG